MEELQASCSSKKTPAENLGGKGRFVATCSVFIGEYPPFQVGFFASFIFINFNKTTDYLLSAIVGSAVC